MSELVPSLQERAEIDDLYNGYLWALDTGDTDGFVAAFFEDAIIREDQPDGSTFVGQGAEAIRGFALKFHRNPKFPGHQHRESTRIFATDPALRADRYAIRSYVFATDFDVASHSARAYWSGYYRDIVGKRNGVWKFVDRWIAPWKGDVLKRFPRV